MELIKNYLHIRKNYFALALALTMFFSSQGHSAAWNCSFVLNTAPTVPFGVKLSQAENIVRNLPPAWDVMLELLPTETIDYRLKIVKILKSKSNFAEWAVGFRADFLKKKDEVSTQLTGVNRARRTLELVMMDRAKKHGFVLDHQGEIFSHFASSNEAFFERFEKGELFYDIGFQDLQAYVPEFGWMAHGPYSHALQMLFIAEFFPQFVEKGYRKIGEKKDSYLWANYFDFVRMPGVINNAVFERVLQIFVSEGYLGN